MMQPQTSPRPTGNPPRTWLLWFTGVAAATATLIVAVFVWIDSSKEPTVTFLATPQLAIVVDARGAIATPGVFTLQPGSRVIDVIDAGGGLTDSADNSLINLSTRVYDGQMIVFPTMVSPNETATTSKLNINTATLEQLMELPGIGEVLAGRIVAFRDANGPFQSVDELLGVDGISDGVLEEIRPYITVSGGG